MRSLLKLALTVGALFGAAWFYGSRQPREYVASSSIVLVAQPAAVWPLVRDIERTQSWWSDVMAVRRLTGRPRESWEQDMGRHGKVRFEVTSEISGERLTTTILNDEQLDWGGTWTYHVRATAAGTEVRIVERGWVEKPLDRVLAKLRGGPHRALDSYLRSLGAYFGETVTPRHDPRV